MPTREEKRRYLTYQMLRCLDLADHCDTEEHAQTCRDSADQFSALFERAAVDESVLDAVEVPVLSRIHPYTTYSR